MISRISRFKRIEKSERIEGDQATQKKGRSPATVKLWPSKTVHINKNRQMRRRRRKARVYKANSWGKRM